MAERVNILALDTSSTACSVALLYKHPRKGSRVLATHKVAPKQHTSIVLPMIKSLLDEAGLKLADLHAIAFGCGPGSFTGIRIAASLAQGIGYANSLPVIPVSSLAAAAQAAYEKEGWSKIMVAVDARMRQIYWSTYEINNGLVINTMPEQLISPHEVAALEGENWFAIGDGWDTYKDQIFSMVGIKPNEIDTQIVPTAEAVLTLAKVKYDKGEWVDAADAAPVYLR